MREAQTLAIPGALALRRYLNVYFSALERALAELKSAAQLGVSAPRRRFISGDDGELTIRDYDPYEIYADDPEELSKFLLARLYAAAPHDLLHIREDRRGWKLRISVTTVCITNSAPRIAGAASTTAVAGQATAGAFVPVKLFLLPAQVTLHQIYAQMAAPEPPAGEDWDDVFAAEDSVFSSLWKRFEDAGVVRGGKEAPSQRGAVESSVLAEGCALLDPSLLSPQARSHSGRVAAASTDAAAAARRLATTLGGRYDRAQPRVPGGADVTMWQVKNRAGQVVAEISDLPEIMPIRTFKSASGKLHGGCVAVLLWLTAELWTLEALAQREVIPAAVGAKKQAAVLRTIAAVRKVLRADPAREWLESELYGQLSPPKRSRKNYFKGDPQFAAP